MKKEVIAYIHSHWDREWYREYEIFRLRLLRVFDNVLDMLENDKIPSFYFDGQTAALLDYLEIRPEKEEQIKKFVQNKKLFIGPFYCLTDEFLTDETCFRKNLELGLEVSKKFGCSDFTAYFADTFGHTASTIPILREYGINTAIVWRGIGDSPSEFLWKTGDFKIDTVNLVRGYFQDVFSTKGSIEQKAEFLKTNLDKISEKSGNVLLLPIGADHLGVETDLQGQIDLVNGLLEDYYIKIGSIFEYIERVKDNFSKCEINGELRDNSKTFILEGCYSSRLDIKKYNVEASYKLDLANKLVKYEGAASYNSVIDYAYRLLLQNQAHDSICGCSTDDVHFENISRYKKILQIANTIIDEIRFKKGYDNKKILNLSDTSYTGTVEFKSTKQYPYQVIKTEKGFDKTLLTDTQRIPITEDYTDIYTYCLHVSNITGLSELPADNGESDVFITDNSIGNSKIFLSVHNGIMKIGNMPVRIIDYKDNGDSYNTGYIEGDEPLYGEIISSKIVAKGSVRGSLGVEIKVGDDILNIVISLDKDSELLKFNIDWENTKKNHLMQFVIETGEDIKETYSEDFENIIKREFALGYDVRRNLPKTKGIEVRANTAPMHRGVCANGVGIVTKGITQYEVFNNELRIPILRSTGVISNPINPARTTPAGPPIETDGLQQIGKNSVEFYVFFGENLKNNIDTVFHKCVII